MINVECLFFFSPLIIWIAGSSSGGSRRLGKDSPRPRGNGFTSSKYQINEEPEIIQINVYEKVGYFCNVWSLAKQYKSFSICGILVPQQIRYDLKIILLFKITLFSLLFFLENLWLSQDTLAVRTLHNAYIPSQ